MNGIVIDTSAFVAILEGEPEAERFLSAIRAAGRRLMGSATFIELSIVVAHRRGEAGLVPLDALLARLSIEIVALSVDHASIARDAWLKFGKGRHPARLNFGDCCSYALARASGLPLLWKGDDFGQTDVEAAGA